MRFHQVGLSLSLILAVCVSARAEIKGEVQSLGFNNSYRPDSWTPTRI